MCFIKQTNKQKSKMHKHQTCKSKKRNALKKAPTSSNIQNHETDSLEKASVSLAKKGNT